MTGNQTSNHGRLAWVDTEGCPIGAVGLDALAIRALRGVVGHVALVAAAVAGACAVLAARSVPYLGMGYGSMLSTAVSYATTSPSLGALSASLLCPVGLMAVCLATRSFRETPACLAVSRACALASASVTSLLAWTAVSLLGLALVGGQVGYAITLGVAAVALAWLSVTDLRASGLARMSGTPRA